MATGVVFEGKTLDDAVRKGLDALGLSRAEVSITVMEEGSSGFLGIGARPYKVRIMPRPGGPPPEPKYDEDRARRGVRGRDRGGRERDRGGRRDERGRGRPGQRGGQPAVAGREERGRGEGRGPRPARSEPPRLREEREPRREDRGVRERDEREPRREDRGVRERDEREPRHEDGAVRERDERGRDRDREGRVPETRSAQSPEASGPMAGPESRHDEEREGRRRRRRGGRGRRGRGPEPERERVERVRPGPEGGGDDMAPVSATATATAPVTVPGHAPEAAGLPPEQLAAEARRLTDQVLRAMGFEATVSATAEDDRADVSISVEAHDDLLTGPKGEVRQALQHLLNLMINRGQTGRYHLQLEINDFWKRREQELVELARSMAEEAVAGGSEAVTEYLNAQERRIVHMTLKDDPRVKTYALGTGLIKRVAVAPADFAGGPSEEEN